MIPPFATSKVSPNDVDIVILPGPDFSHDRLPVAENEVFWPFLHIIVPFDQADLEKCALIDFGFDRKLRPKGVLEIDL